MHRQTRRYRLSRLFLAGGIALLSCLPSVAGPARAQGAQPPHAWLFGTWSGGIFPVPTALTAEACLSQPVVIFTRDVVLRATLTDQLFTQRLIATARATPSGTEFTFRAGDSNAAANGLFGISGPPPVAGFGCNGPDVLHVERHGENQITFPGCADFPNPLVRCPNR